LTGAASVASFNAWLSLKHAPKPATGPIRSPDRAGAAILKHAPILLSYDS